jgi:hypothetical protein
MTAPCISRTLAACEAAIETGMRSYLEVGLALIQVRDGRLYRAQYATFEDYCLTRWEISRQRAYHLMSAAEAVTAIGDTAPIPANEGQARELAGLEPDVAAHVMRTAHASIARVTAAVIRQAREQIVADTKPPAPEPAPEVDATVADEPPAPRPHPPLADEFRRAAVAVRKDVERLERLTTDSRFAKNLGQIARRNLSDLTQAHDAIQRVVNLLAGV